MIRATDDLITLPHVARSIRRDGKSISQQTVYRWVKEGICGVRLETIMQGARRVTTMAAVDLFFQQVTAAKDRRPCAATNADREAEAQAYLDKVFGRKAGCSH